MESKPTVETAFVLSGGGNLGAVQVGMLRGLLEAGITPDVVVGTSIGALNGAFLAGHGDVPGMEALGGLWASIRRPDVFPVSVRSLVRGVLGHQHFLFDSLGLRTLLTRAGVGFDRLEDAPIPLRLVATDLATGDPVVLEEGDVIGAMLASSAIPGVFPSVELDGRTLVDGGVVANTPILQADAMDPEVIYVLPTAPDHLPEHPGNAIAMMQRAMALSARPGERRAIAEVSERRIVRVVPVPALAGRLSLFDFGLTPQLMDEAYAITSSWLAGDGTWRPEELEVPSSRVGWLSSGALGGEFA